MEHTKALYTSLRLQALGIALSDSEHPLEAWKVEDLREVPQAELFERLALHDISLDKMRFMAFANEYDTLEEFVEALAPDALDEDADAIFLLVFELWRRLLPEKQTVSLICDELDYQIYLYDSQDLDTLEALDDAIASFYGALKEATDSGIKPQTAFIAIQEDCAHDIQSFLYDYISELLEAKEYSYAQELMEQFYPFLTNRALFDFLSAKIVGLDEPKRAIAIISKITSEDRKQDLYLNLDILEYLAQLPYREPFFETAKKTLLCITEDDDIEELLRITKEFFLQQGQQGLIPEEIEPFEVKKQKLLDLYSSL